jgi:PleD family two-component response regulator
MGTRRGDRVIARLAERLQQTFRGEDVVGRWGGEEFLLGMYGMSQRDAQLRLEQTLAHFAAETFQGPDDAAFQVSFSGGIAEFPTDGEDLATLYQAADAALYRAKEGGRRRICRAAASEDLVDSFDVILVEDDDTLAGLLQHALETRGFRSHRFEGGHQALEALSGPRPRVHGKLLILDVDLPGIDGISLLRRLANDGVTRRSRALMLTARSGEGEVVEALKLGAIDHVAKPFSIPVLMERVRRALAE